MAIIHGRNLIVSLNGTPIVGARSCEITVNTGEIEISSPSQGAWRDFIVERKEWTVSTSHLVTAGGNRLKTEAAMVGQTVTLRFTEKDTQDILTGEAIVKSWKATGTLGNLAQGAFSCRGKGAVS